MKLLSVALVLLAFAACAPARPAEVVLDSHDAEPLTPETSPIGLRRSLVADQYFWLRAKVLEGEAPAPFVDALTAMRELRADLAADPTAWEDLEVPLGTVRRASELTTVYGELPVTRDVGGRPMQLRARALRLSRALEATEGAYRAGPFREHDAEIQRAAKDLGARLLPQVETILRAIEADMALPGVTRPIVVTLVGDAPYPGIFAADARGRASASFVRVHGLEGAALCETVLHEAIHSIDELTVRLPTAMNALRRALEAKGIGDDDPSLEMAVNTVTFAEAASLVRRFIDPKHRPLGESGFYNLYPPARAIVDAWDKHINGAPLEETMDTIAKAVAAS
ncbi:MAG: hypothetical protein KIT84_26800 [Labilithrix sp.]|nr:hypothetical protein [Labilithrix sp.]MCW5814664.1 hypothetical protein [Labilithrix sp.]